MTASVPAIRQAAARVIALRKDDMGLADPELEEAIDALEVALASADAGEGASQKMPQPPLIDWDAAHRIAYQAAAAFRPSYFNGPGFIAHNWVVEAVRSAHMDGYRQAFGLPPIDRQGALRKEDREAAAQTPGEPAVADEGRDAMRNLLQRLTIAVSIGHFHALLGEAKELLASTKVASPMRGIAAQEGQQPAPAAIPEETVLALAEKHADWTVERTDQQVRGFGFRQDGLLAFAAELHTAQG